MTLAQKLFEYIQGKKPEPFCDDCLAEVLEAPSRQTVNARTEAFGLCREFTREKGVCTRCKEEKLTVAAR